MEFRKVLALRGPNIWARFTVLEAWVDLGDLKDSPSDALPGFNDRVMGWLPTMIEHRCSEGVRGGFFERLRRGTYLAHILEHVTLELQALAGYSFGFGRARETTREGLFRVAVRYEDEAVGRACLESGRRLCLAAVYDQPYDIAAEVRELRKLATDVRMGPSTRAVAEAARARGIPVRRLTEGSLLLLGNGARQRRTHRSATAYTSAVCESISDDKELTKSYLRSAGVPIAQGRIVTSAADAWQASQEIGTPVVVKPRDCNYGTGVVAGISNREKIEAAYELATRYSSGIMVEKLATGAEHRLLVVGGKFVAAARGNPAYIVGDGVHTVWELVESQLNTDPRRGEDWACPLALVEDHPTVRLVIEQEGFTVDAVPPAGKQVMIQRNGNLGLDVTDSVHSSTAAHAELAARVLNLDVAGVDIIADDISRPLEEQGGVIIEVNASPGLQMHIDPAFGTPRPVGEAIVDTMFDAGDDGRIPLVCVSGEESTGEVAQRIAQALAAAGQCAGLACDEGIFVGGQCVQTGDRRDAESTRLVLLNPLVDAAVVVPSVESILTEGLGFDHCQVAVVTSMGAGVKLDLAEQELPEKRVLIYRASTDMVLPTGAVVMKAGEELGPLVAAKCPGRVILFSLDEHNATLAEHRAAGGWAVFARNGQIALKSPDSQTALSPAGGAIDEALLAAVAACWALGISPALALEAPAAGRSAQSV